MHWRDRVTNTIFSNSRRALIDLPKPCMVIKDVVYIIKDANNFSIKRIEFPTGCTEKFGVNDPTRVFSAITS